MNKLIFNKITNNKFKILNATNGGPWHKSHANDQYRSNFSTYKDARIPYSRNHDSGVIGVYGGPYSHDISKIFPNFDADVNDPNSYDFACTDDSILTTLSAGTKTFFRLGETIEHQIKKHATLPPKNFQKWAEICEHVILHYNYGWANGFNLDIEYWEIWNEPDLDSGKPTPKRTWGGTDEEFYDLYEITAKYLKSKFPHLKIGGPAVSGRKIWSEQFIKEMAKRNVPMDYFSWHSYGSTPEHLVKDAYIFDEMLKNNGYTDIENILNEWNYVKGWQAEFVYSIECIHGLKNASLILSTMALSQPSPIDMLMYYDTRPSAFCGIFDYYTYRPLKGYYALKWYSNFYDCAYEIKSENSLENVYGLCGAKEDGKIICALTYYSDDDNAPNKEFEVEFNGAGKYEIYIVDKVNDEKLIDVTDKIKLNLPVHACVLIKQI